MLERIFESILWNSRFVVTLAVVFGLLGALILFAVASIDVVVTAKYVVTTYLAGAHPANFHQDVIGGIIGAVDLYLIGVVMLLFAFGLYELFISEIEVAKESKHDETQLLAIHSLDQLKDKISKVIVMVLVVGFFQKVGYTEYNGALDMLYLALSITAVSVGLYFLGKVGKK